MYYENYSDGDTSVDYESSSEGIGIYTGYVGRVSRIIHTSVVELKFSLNNVSEFAALDRCRLCIDGSLCSKKHQILDYISIGDAVNFDAALAQVGYGIDFRVVTAWIGKKPRGDDFITSQYAPTHRIIFPYDFCSNN